MTVDLNTIIRMYSPIIINQKGLMLDYPEISITEVAVASYLIDIYYSEMGYRDNEWMELEYDNIVNALPILRLTVNNLISNIIPVLIREKIFIMSEDNKSIRK